MRWTPTHGQRAMYGRGCRCDSCRAANTEYKRAFRTGVRTGWPKADVSTRFWAKVRKTDGCWLWDASRDDNGYGQFSLNGRPVKAQRVAWLLTHGTLTPGMDICHRCDNPPCVRPDHLFEGTRSDNLGDMAMKGRHVGTRRLTHQQVADIRASLQAGTAQQDLAEQYGVAPSLISMIATGKRHVLPTMQAEAAAALEALTVRAAR